MRPRRSHGSRATLGNCVHMRLQRPIIECSRRDRELRQRRLKVDCFGDLGINFSDRQFDGWPSPFAFPLNPSNSAAQRLAANMFCR
jgi:hypothetical protein